MTFKKSLLVVAVATALLSACSVEKVALQDNNKHTTAADNTTATTTQTASDQSN